MTWLQFIGAFAMSSLSIITGKAMATLATARPLDPIELFGVCLYCFIAVYCAHVVMRGT